MSTKGILVSAFIVLFSVVLPLDLCAQVSPPPPTPKTIDELRKAIVVVMQETRTPAVAIALVYKEGPVWMEAFGKADVEKDINATTETLFRIGSTSKIFVALAILKLQEQGKLNLKDKVGDLVPEIEYKNPWENTHPVLVEHLLEHTTGWSDLHLPEHNQFGEKVVSLREALEFHPHSRVSRWIPGTRMSYSNTGPNVAAYIVEKITAQSYEDYVRENFFSPLGMETATYRFSEHYKQKGAKLYREGSPSEYGHMLMRASGSINASVNEMAKLLKFMINRGTTDSIRLISESSIKRMETPSTTSGARAGLPYGYGLCLYTSPHREFTYYKHGGGVGNGSCDFSYLPEHGVGYVILMNANNPGGSIWTIGDLIRNFQTQTLPHHEQPTPTFHSRRTVNGYYHEINPRTTPLGLPSLTATKVWTDNDTLYTQQPPFFGETKKYVAISNDLYQSVTSKKTELVFTNDPLAGEVFELADMQNGTITFGTISGAVVFARYAVLLLWIILIVVSILLVPVWVFRYWRRKIAGGANVHIRIWPLLPVAFLLLSFVLLVRGMAQSIEPFARPSLFSVGIMMSSIAFFVTAIFALMMAVRYRHKYISGSVYVLATALSALHTVVAFYLLWHGVIGVRTWA